MLTHDHVRARLQRPESEGLPKLRKPKIEEANGAPRATVLHSREHTAEAKGIQVNAFSGGLGTGRTAKATLKGSSERGQRVEA